MEYGSNEESPKRFLGFFFNSKLLAPINAIQNEYLLLYNEKKAVTKLTINYYQNMLERISDLCTEGYYYDTDSCY